MTFLKKDKRIGDYVEINDKDARQKISHAIRYRRNAEATITPREDSSDDTFSPARARRTENFLPSHEISNNSSSASSRTASSVASTDLFEDDELDSVLPPQLFRQSSLPEVIFSNELILADPSEPPKALNLSPPDVIFDEDDDSSLDSDLQDFLFDGLIS